VKRSRENQPWQFPQGKLLAKETNMREVRDAARIKRRALLILPDGLKTNSFIFAKTCNNHMEKILEVLVNM
jgi:hypothetical protein